MSVKRFLCVLFMMMGHVLRGAVCHREGAFGSDLYTCWFPQMAPGCWAEYCLRGSKGEHGAISHICVSLSCVSSLTCYCPCAHPSQEQTGLRCQEMEVRLGECPWKGAGKVGIQPFPMPLLRLVADVLNDIAMFMEILAPSFPACFTFIVCIAGILKSIVGVAGGATRAALTLHQARRDNMADVSAKDGSQETLVNLAGLLVSLVLIPLVTNNALLTFVLFFSFTVLHLLANYKAVRSIVMETLNEARLSILLHQYLHDGRILSPSEANSREPVFLEFRRRVPIKFGVKFGDLITSPDELRLALKNNSKAYLIGMRDGRVLVCRGSDTSAGVEIKAASQALCLSMMLCQMCPPEGALKALSATQTQNPWEMVSESHKIIDQMFPLFLNGRFLCIAPSKQNIVFNTRYCFPEDIVCQLIFINSLQ
uniref:RUS family member 1 n=1 Tax=Paramormyrops kingsleyae TaxID=1676925 RepID=A0A3B3TF24_9TELE